MYESPSPPASEPGRQFSYDTTPPRHAQTDSKVVPLRSTGTQPISPIHPDGSLWPTSHYVPVLTDETSRLVPPIEILPEGDLLSRPRYDLTRAPLASRESMTQRYRDDNLRDRSILGCSILLVTSIVFVIIVSGMTTMLANSNFPQLQILAEWSNGGTIPLKYGCLAEDGAPISFPLRWRNVPRASTNLVILFANSGAMLHAEDDPVHWLVTDIPLKKGGEYYLAANASANSNLMPLGAKQHSNRYSRSGAYWPPCAAENSTSLFVIHAYAIEASPIIDNFRDAREVMNRFVGVPFAKLTGVYGRPVPTGPAKSSAVH